MGEAQGIVASGPSWVRLLASGALGIVPNWARGIAISLASDLECDVFIRVVSPIRTLEGKRSPRSELPEPFGPLEPWS